MTGSDDQYFFVSREGDDLCVQGDRHYSRGYNQSTRTDASLYETSWSWDGKELSVHGDRYGIAQLFYCRWENCFAISTSIDLLLDLGVPRDLDTAGLAVFLKLGYYIGNKTAFRHIHVLGPGAQLRWCNGEISETEMKPNVGKFQGSRSEALDIYASSFSEAIKDLTPGGRVAVPLSGGRDSRHILLELWQQKRLPDHCLTVEHQPPRTNEDLKIAKRLADAVGVKFVALSNSPKWVVDELSKNVRTNYCADEHGWFLPVGRHLQDSADAIFDGLAGDVLSESKRQTREHRKLYADGKFEELAKKMMSAGNAAFGELAQGLVLSADLRGLLDNESPVADLARELKKFSGLPNPLAAFYFWNRTRRKICLAPMRCHPASLSVNFPYLHSAVFDFLLSCPAAFSDSLTFHSETIKQAYPDFVDIPYEEDIRASVPKNSAGAGRALSLLFLLRKSSFTLLNCRALLPRLLRDLLRFESKISWLSPQMIIYLFQLETKIRL